MVENILPTDPNPAPDTGLWSNGQNSTFTEHGHVAYQIKENDKCSNIVANILPADPILTPDPVVGVKRFKIQHFRDMVMLHTKLKGIRNAA